jgi:hypothetical protein
MPNTKSTESSSAIVPKSISTDQAERPSITQQSNIKEPETSEPETSEPKTSEPKTSEPQTSEPQTPEPQTPEPKNRDSKREEPTSEVFKTATAAPMAKTDEAKEPKNKKPKTEKPKNEKLQTVERAPPKTEEVKTQQPKPEESKPEEPKAEEPKTKQHRKEISREEPRTKEPTSRSSIANPLKDDTSSSKPRPLRSREESTSAQADTHGSEGSESNDSSSASDRNVDTKSSTRLGKPQPAASRGTTPPPLPPGKAKGRETPKPVRPSKNMRSSPTSTSATPSSGTSGIEKGASRLATPHPPPDAPVVELPGYQPTEDQVAIVRAIGISLAAVAAISSIPAIMDIIDHIRAEASLGVARWAYLVLMLATLQVAYAAYVFQLPDWSTVWVVTIVTLVISTGYAMMLGLTLITHGDTWLVGVLDLGDAFRGGRVSLWCFVMLCLTSLVSYFSGRISVRWRGELTAT